MRLPFSAASGIVLVIVLTLSAGAGATRTGQLQGVGLTVEAGTRSGAIIPAGEAVPLIVTVRPAGRLVGQGGRLVAQVRGAKNMSRPNAPNFEQRLERRLATRPDYRSTKSCRRTPCRLQVRSSTETVWDFKAVLLDGSRPVEWSPSVRVVWHTEPQSITLEKKGLFSCTKRLPNDGTPGDRLICNGTITIASREEVIRVPNNTGPIEVTGRINPRLPDGWVLRVYEQGGHEVCRVPRLHRSDQNSCSGLIGNSARRENQSWPFEVQVIEYNGPTGPHIGQFGIAETQLWWGCPFGGYIPQCP
jgi:hypothetical protein